MPFLIRWPNGFSGGHTNDPMVQNVDYAPTLLDAVGIDIPPDMQGRSILPILQGSMPADWRTNVYYHYYQTPAFNLSRMEGVRGDRYKLISYYYHTTGVPEWELFDLQTDPHEMVSQYTNPAYAGIVTMMTEQLEALRGQYNVPDPIPGDINIPPTAADDWSGVLPQDASTIDVLINDRDGNNDLLTIVSVTQGSFGSVAINGQTITYTPNNGYIGIDRFTYTINDESNGVHTGTVTLEVLPSLSAYEAWMEANTTLTGRDAAALVDFDGDGRFNLVDYAIGADPEVFDPDILALDLSGFDAGTDEFLVNYRRRIDLAQGEINYIIEWNTDIGIALWQSGGLSQDGPTTPIGDGMTESVTLRGAIPAGGTLSLRLRLGAP